MCQIFAISCLFGSLPEFGPRNVVIIVADDMGVGDVRKLNPLLGKIATPNLDRLCDEGMVFTDAHSPSSICSPTRYGLLTGRYAWRTRLQSGAINSFANPLIATGRPTVGTVARVAGCRTAVFGKWHLGFRVGSRPTTATNANVGETVSDGPTTRGFDRFAGYHHAATMNIRISDNTVIEPVASVDMLSQIVSDTTGWIAEQAFMGNRFLAYVALSAPHNPVVPSPQWVGQSGLGPYGDFVMQTDAAVGSILDAIEDAGESPDTLVIFTSDNGCTPEQLPGLKDQGHFPNGAWRGAKRSLWEGGHRVPLVVRWPLQVQPGTSDALVCLTDVYATLVALWGVDVGGGEDSVEFASAMLGAVGQGRSSVVLHSNLGRFAIRAGRWKLMFGGNTVDGGGSEEWLSDLVSDQTERTNYRSGNGVLASQLLTTLRSVRDAHPNDVEIDLRK